MAHRGHAALARNGGDMFAAADCHERSANCYMRAMEGDDGADMSDDMLAQLEAMEEAYGKRTLGSWRG